MRVKAQAVSGFVGELRMPLCMAPPNGHGTGDTGPGGVRPVP